MLIPELTTTALRFDGPGAGVAFRLGRLLFGLVFAFVGLNHLLDVDDMTGYAQAKGLPAARFTVVASGVMLGVGGLGIAAGVYPSVAAGDTPIAFGG